MTNAERILRAVKRKGESEDFYRYCENMLAYFPLTNLPALREYYKHGATALEVKITHGIEYS